MDNQRVFVWAALALVLWLNYITWQRDYAPAPIAPGCGDRALHDSGATRQRHIARRCQRTTATPQPRQPTAAPRRPSKPVDTAAGEPADDSRHDRRAVDGHQHARRRARARRSAQVSEGEESARRSGAAVQCDDPGLFVARSGLRAADNAPQPTHLAIFRSEANEYRLQAGEAKLTVPLTWTEGRV